MINKLFPFLFIILSQVGATEPVISSLLPRGGQLGSTQEIVITGQRLKGAEEIFFYDKGISAIEIIEEKETKLSAKFVISDDAKIGQHELRLRTKNGISKLFTFWVGPFPNKSESEPNSALDEAQIIPLNVTVNGVAQNEDVDYFEINATQGQRISAEVEAIRLSGPLFDPYVAILDENRFEIATSDDSELLLQDSTTSVIAPKTGKYYIEVRESSYRGNGSYRYRLHVGSFPRPLVVTPAGGEAGKPIEFTFLEIPKVHLKRPLLCQTTSEQPCPIITRKTVCVPLVPTIYGFQNFPQFRKWNPITALVSLPKQNFQFHSHLTGLFRKTAILTASVFRQKKETATILEHTQDPSPPPSIQF